MLNLQRKKNCINYLNRFFYIIIYNKKVVTIYYGTRKKEKGKGSKYF